MRALLWALGLLVAGLGLEVAFWAVTGSRGLLAPGGTPHLDVVALGVLFLLVRITVRLVVPGLVVYGLLTLRPARRAALRRAAAPAPGRSAP